MGEFIPLTAGDGHKLQAWLARPAGAARGAVVVLQEIFGVNGHIRAVTDGFAQEGYLAIAPALFDRVRPGIEMGYSQPELQEGVGYMGSIPVAKSMLDIQAAMQAVREGGRVGISGYCWGGALSYVAAADLAPACAVVYYGNASRYADRKPRCPVLYHFGTQDKSIPMTDVDKIRAADPAGIFYEYEAGHGFSAEPRSSYNPEAAALARRRTLDFLSRHLAGPAAAPHKA